MADGERCEARAPEAKREEINGQRRSADESGPPVEPPKDATLRPAEAETRTRKSAAAVCDDFMQMEREIQE